MTKKKQDISVVEFVNWPICRYSGLGISVFVLLLIFIIPMPNYVEKEGIIASAETMKDSLRDGTGGPRRLEYWVNVEYQVDGRDYKIKKIMTASKPIFDNRPIKVFYDSKNPRNAHLSVPGFSIHTLLILIFLFMGAGTGFLFWWSKYTAKVKEETAQANREARQKVLNPVQVAGHPGLFQIGCPKCEAPIHYQAHLAGHKIKCSQCGFLIALPAIAMRQQQFENPQANLQQNPFPQQSYQDPNQPNQ